MTRRAIVLLLAGLALVTSAACGSDNKVGDQSLLNFKEQAGNSMALLNLEYEIGWRNGLKGAAFYDLGRAAPTGVDAPWLKGVGWGVGVGDMRVDFGYRLDDVPGSLQVLFRFSRTF